MNWPIAGLPPAPIDPLHPKSNGFPRALDKQTGEGRSSTAALEATPAPTQTQTG